jgi:WD40 repeat protein
MKKCKYIHRVQFLPDGSKLFAIGRSREFGEDQAFWIDIATDEVIDTFTLRANGYALSADLTKLAMANPHSAITRKPHPVAEHYPSAWIDPTRGGTFQGEVESHLLSEEVRTAHIHGFAFSPDGNRLAVSLEVWTVGINDTPFYVLDLANPEKTVSLDASEAAFCGRIAFSPDGKRIATAGGPAGPPAVVVFDSETLQSVQEFSPKGTQTHELLFAPDGETLAVANGRLIYLLPRGGEKPRAIMKEHTKQVNCLAYSPDSRRLLSASNDKVVRLWDATTGSLLQAYDWGMGQMTAITYAPDGLTAVAGGEKGQIVVWDVE